MDIFLVMIQLFTQTKGDLGAGVCAVVTRVREEASVREVARAVFGGHGDGPLPVVPGPGGLLRAIKHPVTEPSRFPENHQEQSFIHLFPSQRGQRLLGGEPG